MVGFLYCALPVCCCLLVAFVALWFALLVVWWGFAGCEMGVLVLVDLMCGVLWAT